MSDRSTYMHAMVLTEDRAIELQSRPAPTLGLGEVVELDIDLCGICGSDLHAAEVTQVYTGGHILGHEAVGRIRAIGSGVAATRSPKRSTERSIPAPSARLSWRSTWTW
jgi:D-arabinose 1-dehydrogenase-like Zn-dependent alcohol dehydrogenase